MEAGAAGSWLVQGDTMPARGMGWAGEGIIGRAVGGLAGVPARERGGLGFGLLDKP